MKPNSKYRLLCAAFALGAVLLGLAHCSEQSKTAPNTGGERVKLRVGWQVAWATQGQIAQVLAHTDIAKRHGLDLEFAGFSYGAPLNEAALAKRVDVGFTADMPVINLLARGGDYAIVARLMEFRGALIVPVDSSVRTLLDLRGKKIAIPFGSTTHRVALEILSELDLVPGRDFEAVNLDIAEQSALVQSGGPKQWPGGTDALASWDPNVAIFVERGLARVLTERTGLSVVFMSRALIRNDRSAAERFLKSYVEAYAYYRDHRAEANRWFLEGGKINLAPSILDIVAMYEPNLRRKQSEPIDVGITPVHRQQIARGADFALKQGLIRQLPDLRRSIDDTVLRDALAAKE